MRQPHLQAILYIFHGSCGIFLFRSLRFPCTWHTSQLRCGSLLIPQFMLWPSPSPHLIRSLSSSGQRLLYRCTSTVPVYVRGLLNSGGPARNLGGALSGHLILTPRLPRWVLSQCSWPSPHWLTAATFKTAKDNMSQTTEATPVYSPL